MELIKIKTEFLKQGFKYTQVKRTRHLAIYHQQLINGRAEYWEVWVIKIREARTIGDTFLPRTESAPGPEDWGVFGWTFYTFQGADFRFNELLQHQRYADGTASPFRDNVQGYSKPPSWPLGDPFE
jgi:hypothetical protein